MAYGFVSNKSNGTSLISSTDGVARLIYAQDFNYNYSGSIYVPDFDANLGFYFVRIKPLKGYTTGSITNPTATLDYAGTTSWSVGLQDEFVFRNQQEPSLSWNNATKYLTVSAASAISTFSKLGGQVCNYKLFMVHYK